MTNTYTADLGTPQPTTCPKCTSEQCVQRPVVLGDSGVTNLPAVMKFCRACGYIAKHGADA